MLVLNQSEAATPVFSSKEYLTKHRARFPDPQVEKRAGVTPPFPITKQCPSG